MSKTIYKYTVPVGGVYVFDLPLPAEIVHVDCQEVTGTVVFWAVIDTASPDVRRYRLQVVGTGHIWPAGARYVGTAMAPPFVWHLLELDS
jgi:hypothetical protein